MREQRKDSEKDYKYQKQIDELTTLGCNLNNTFHITKQLTDDEERKGI